MPKTHGINSVCNCVYRHIQREEFCSFFSFCFLSRISTDVRGTGSGRRSVWQSEVKCGQKRMGAREISAHCYTDAAAAAACTGSCTDGGGWVGRRLVVRDSPMDSYRPRPLSGPTGFGFDVVDSPGRLIIISRRRSFCSVSRYVNCLLTCMLYFIAARTYSIEVKIN